MIKEEEATCERCQAEIETDFHRYYGCKANDCIEDDDVSKTKWLIKKAKAEPQHLCLWMRAILPGCLTGTPVGWAPEDEEADHFDDNFTQWLNDTGKAGTDGTGGADNDARTRRTYAGAAVLNQAGDKVAYMYCKVRGRQTVPRAELTAILRTLKCIRKAREWTIYIDVQYVINGLCADNKAYYRQGRNGDEMR